MTDEDDGRLNADVCAPYTRCGFTISRRWTYLLDIQELVPKDVELHANRGVSQLKLDARAEGPNSATMCEARLN